MHSVTSFTNLYHEFPRKFWVVVGVHFVDKIGGTLVCSAITNDTAWSQQLMEATNIDRLNIGPIPTIKLDWLQPHEGNIVDFLFRARAFQTTPEKLKA